MGTLTVQRPPGERTCSIDGCDRRHDAKGLCKSHGKRVREGSKLTGVIGRKGCQGASNPRWRGDAVGYLGAHHRVYRARGAASRHQCAHCPKAAKHWAYDHADPNAKIGNDGPYSLDFNRYLPLCGSCHKSFDLANAREGC